jgi:hypothetical protein
VNREEYLAMLAAEPATPHQRGAILREFERLGFDDADRAERLAVCAALLELDELGSTADLLMGQAGQLVNMLQRTRHRAELPDATAVADEPAGEDDRAGDGRADAGDGQGDEHASEDQPPAARLTVAEVIARMIARWLAAFADPAAAHRSDAPVGKPDPGHRQDREL